MTDNCTALTLIVPNEFTMAINSIRVKYDHACPRWMPHVNFMFPFVPPELFPDVKRRLENALANIDSFALTLDQLGFFKQKRNVTFHLKTNDQSRLDNLFQVIRNTLPEVTVKHPTFKAHMTLGKCRKRDFNKIKAEIEETIPLHLVAFQVNKIYIIERSHEDKTVPFHIVHEIPLKNH